MEKKVEIGEFIGIAFSIPPKINFIGKCIASSKGCIGLGNINEDFTSFDGVTYFKRNMIKLVRELDHDEIPSNHSEWNSIPKIKSMGAVFEYLFRAHIMCAVFIGDDFDNYFEGFIQKMTKKKIYFETYTMNGERYKTRKLLKKSISGVSFGTSYEEKMTKLVGGV